MKTNLPVKAYARHPAMPHRVVELTHREAGYRTFQTRWTPDELNAMCGVTPPQARAMLHGAQFGWDMPAADPDHPINQG